jgi:glycosyltransferase involved in cell wall biosynthesis
LRAEVFAGGGEEIEEIVADNDSTDRTAEVAAAHGARVVHVAKRRIGAARNGAARVARGEILCFIDADSAVHPQTFDAIDERMKSDRYVWGVTGARLDRKSIRHSGHALHVHADGLDHRPDIGLSFFAAAKISKLSAATTRIASTRKTCSFRWRCAVRPCSRGQQLTRVCLK